MKRQADGGSPPEGFRELTLFPGVEISVQGGFHLLAILTPNATTSDIDTLLGQVDYDGTKGDSTGVTRKGAAEVVCEIRDAGGIPIPAHADRKVIMATARAFSLYVQVPVNSNSTPTRFAKCLILNVCWQWSGKTWRNLLPKHVEKQAKKAGTRVLGSDCHSFQGMSVFPDPVSLGSKWQNLH